MVDIVTNMTTGIEDFPNEEEPLDSYVDRHAGKKVRFN